ncbi:MAG: hypothetical protein CMP28_12555 [Roseibacillus sp.]|nr:hypothetical protein [Roseibacillus sp.]
MPDSREIPLSASSLRALIVLPALLLLPGCHVFSPPAEKQQARATAASLPSTPPRKKVIDPDPARPPRPQRLHMRVDSGISTGLIAIILDPGPLPPRRSTATCALNGSVTVTVTTGNDGTTTFKIESISLANANDGRLRFSWSPLIGSIRTLIPAGILTIRDHTVPASIPLRQDGRFSQPNCHFSVGGTCQVQGSGIILAKKVGRTVEDLTINKTEPVILAGSLSRRDGKWILHIPAATMKDRFNIDDDGTTLDLQFTGNITAVAE